MIAVSQIPDALGLDLTVEDGGFGPRLIAYALALETMRPTALVVTVLTVVAIRVTPRIVPHVPGPLLAIVAGAVAARVLGLDIETVGSRFGGVPTGLPSFHWPRVEAAMIPELVQPALAIALLAGIESLMSAVVADGMTGGKHRSNAELFAQGVANLASPLFGGIPATGAIARTATNVKNGGRTPVAGVVHALTLLIILTSVAPAVSAVPMAGLAGVLLVVAYNMSEFHVFRRLLRGPKSDVLVLLITFGLTVLVDLVVAIEVGVVLAALLFMRRMSEVSTIRSVTNEIGGPEARAAAWTMADVALPEGTEVFEVAGSFFFGSAQRFSEVLSEIRSRPRIVILRMREVLAMDSTGLHALESMHQGFEKSGTLLILSGVHSQP